MAFATKIGTLGPAALTDWGTWSERGPTLGGRLDRIDVTTSGPLLVVGSPGGGAWSMTDQPGQSWQERNGYGDYSFVHLERDAIDSSRLYGLTWNNLFVTTDTGSTWTQIGGGGATPGPLLPNQWGVADPQPFAQLKFSRSRAVFFGRPCDGLAYSFDGTNFTWWFPFSGGQTNPDNCIGNIAADPGSKRLYFSTLNQEGTENVYRTCPWSPGTPCLEVESASMGLPAGRVVAALTSISYGGLQDNLAALIKTGSNHTQTYRTVDGTQWQLVSEISSAAWDPRTLLFGGAVGGTTNELFHGNVYSHYSSNVGSSWTPFHDNYEHPDTRAIAPNAPLQRVYTANDGAFAAGVYWNIVRWTWVPGTAPTAPALVPHTGLRTWQAYYAGVVPPASPSDPERRVFVGSQDNGAVCSSDTGATWTTNGSPGFSDEISIVFAPSNPDRAYARSNSSQYFYRTDNARQAGCNVGWTQIYPVTPSGQPASVSLPDPWHRNVTAVDPSNHNKVYFLRDWSVGVSSDGGVTVATSLLPISNTLHSIHADASGVYVGTEKGGAYISIDGGVSWSPWGLNTNSPELILSIKSVPRSAWWMATTSGLYRKTGGGDWTLIYSFGNYIMNDVAIDPACPSRVYVAFGFVGGQQQHRGGIDVTTDNGASWMSITGGVGLHQTPISDVEVDAAEPKWLYASSYGRGFWMWDWGTALPACQ